MTIRFVLASIGVFMLANLGFAASQGTSGAQFLQIIAAPRAAAMGGAYTALCDDVNSIGFNPAGLGYLEKNEISLAQNNWIQGVSNQYLAAVVPVRSFGSLGLYIKAILHVSDYNLFRILVQGGKMLKDPAKTIGNIIDNVNVSIISSVDKDGFPNTKAMLAPRKRDGIKIIYFTTNTSSMRVKQYITNSKACVYFFDKRFFRGVMLKGAMKVLKDKKSKQMIWQDGDQMYYPLGVTDPDYCVLKFTSKSGRYYSNFKSEDFEV